jgi:hypothetical protein
MAENESSNGVGCFGGGFSIGGIVAFILSWPTFHAFWWAVLAAFFGWGYIIYWLIYYLR